MEVPDLFAVCRNLVEAYRDFDYEKTRRWTLSIYGKHNRTGDSHEWGFTGYALTNIMKEAGFKDVRIPQEHVSDHYLAEPVLLVKGTK